MGTPERASEIGTSTSIEDSKEVINEMDFTVDHFGEGTPLPGAVGVDEEDQTWAKMDHTNNVPPLCASTANREIIDERVSSLKRQDRRNRGVPRTRLDL